jgi:hypothetical protein
MKNKIVLGTAAAVAAVAVGGAARGTADQVRLLAPPSGRAVVHATAVGAIASAHPVTTASAARFDRPQQNPYFPLKPGTVTRFTGTDEGEQFVEKVKFTHRKKTIMGVRTTVVRDVLRRSDGSLAEKTHDWYAADNNGNVWYFGEATATYDAHGKVDSREGTWKAGRRGAVAGLIMPAHPEPTDAYRQEFLKGHAEDQAWIVQRHATVTVPFGKLHDVVRSFEWSRLEKGVVSVKLYARGLGIVREQDLAGGSEVFDLTSVSHH